MIMRDRILLKDTVNKLKVRLVKIEAGQALKARLAAMGLLPGVQFQVLNNGYPGPFIIDLKGTKIALGRGMAGKILVRASESRQNEKN